MINYCYTLNETSDQDIEIMDIISAPNIQQAYEIVLNNIEQLNSKQSKYIWKLAQIEHGDFVGVNKTKHYCYEKCDCDSDCDDEECCCDDKEYGNYDQDHSMPF